VAAATLSNRYITDRFLPDKAIDLVDEAASKLKMEIDSMPGDRPGAAQAHAAGDRAAGAQEGEGRRQQGASSCWSRELADLNEQRSGMKAQWLREKELITEVRDVKADAEQPASTSSAPSAGGLRPGAARMQYGEIPGPRRAREGRSKTS
jgi:ATP-dependent Clp protease ATP-binding subunit ClpB